MPRGSMLNERERPPEGAESDTVELQPDPKESAKAAGLRYVHDAMPGIRRKRRGDHFIYYAPDGSRITDAQEIERINHLGVPPAWMDVWICPNPHGHIQATGRDAKGRKQYRYHPRWAQVRDEAKYERMVAFGEKLPAIRARVEQDLSLPGLPREKALATVVALLDMTLIRIGNETYARENEAYGLTTLRQDHVDVEGASVRFEFRGKSGKEQQIEVRNRKLARIVRKYLDLPGYELFQYVDAQGQRHSIESDDVNAYLRDITGLDFTAKDFRTWGGTTTALRALRELGGFETKTEARQRVADAIKVAAEQLGNTPAICRKSYVNPGIIEGYLEGALFPAIEELMRDPIPPELASLRPEEIETLVYLRRMEDKAAAQAIAS
jgi:DNA topoisomerase-1